jgi:hypothetical protein
MANCRFVRSPEKGLSVRIVFITIVLLAPFFGLSVRLLRITSFIFFFSVTAQRCVIRILRFFGTKLCGWCEQGSIGSRSFDQFANQVVRDDLAANVAMFNLNGMGKTLLPDPIGILLPCIPEIREFKESIAPAVPTSAKWLHF